MSMSRKEREEINARANDGDQLAVLAEYDISQEDGMEILHPLVRGQMVLIYTATHYFCGKFLGEDHEYYYLAPNSVQVFETGPYDKFYGGNQASDCEKAPILRRVRKGPTINVDDWPHLTPPEKG